MVVLWGLLKSNKEEHRLNGVNVRAGGKYEWCQTSTLSPANVANLNKFWLTGFFEADGCVTVCRTTCACRIIFSQSRRYLLDLIAQRFSSPVQARFRTDKTKPTWQYTVATNRCDTLVTVFQHFNTYPLQGVKHGHLFITQQTWVVKQVVWASKLKKASSLYDPESVF